MATKHFCDGCDKEVERRDDMKRVLVGDLSKGAVARGFSTVQWPPAEPADQLNNQRQFDLCGECHQRFRATLPTSWDRGRVTAA
jgi:hypothetical protein